MPGPIVLVGAPIAFGGHLAGMGRTPGELRRRALVERLTARPGLRSRSIVDGGDASVGPGWAPDADPRTKNRIVEAALGPATRDLVGSARTAHASSAFEPVR